MSMNPQDLIPALQQMQGQMPQQPPRMDSFQGAQPRPPFNGQGGMGTPSGFQPGGMPQAPPDKLTENHAHQTINLLMAYMMQILQQQAMPPYQKMGFITQLTQSIASLASLIPPEQENKQAELDMKKQELDMKMKHEEMKLQFEEYKMEMQMKLEKQKAENKMQIDQAMADHKIKVGEQQAQASQIQAVQSMEQSDDLHQQSLEQGQMTNEHQAQTNQQTLSQQEEQHHQKMSHADETHKTQVQQAKSKPD